MEDCDYGFDIPLFTKEMKETYTILAPDIFPLHMKLIARVFKAYGYHLEILHYAGKTIIDEGLRHIHNDMCYPVVCMTGQQIHALTCGDYDPHKCALIQFQTGGGCRASNYIWMVRKALHNMGLGYVPVISLSLNNVESSPGFRLTPALMVRGLCAIIYGDLLMLLSNQTKPYEKKKGESDALLESWVNRLDEEFKEGKGLRGKSLRKNLEAIASDFAAIGLTGEKKTKVGIVGEIYVKYSPFGNNGLEAFLESQDCEYMVPGVLSFFYYMFDNRVYAEELYGGNWKSARMAEVGTRLCRRIESIMRDVLSHYPQFTAPTTFLHQKELVEPVLDRGMVMGEGWLLPAEIAELITLGYDNVICVQPFGCLPNHIAGKGTVRKLRELYPKANICPVDFDSSASKVNQENRIKLMLSMAREKEE